MKTTLKRGPKKPGRHQWHRKPGNEFHTCRRRRCNARRGFFKGQDGDIALMQFQGEPTCPST